MAGTHRQEQRGRSAPRRAAGWQPLPVLACQVVPAGWTYLVGGSCGNLSFPNGNPADSVQCLPEQRERFGLRGGLPGDSPFVFPPAGLLLQR
jgi:hypothetical protein